MLQNLNADPSWHRGDSDYTEPIEIIAVVTESLTGMWLCDVFWEKNQRAGDAVRAYRYVEVLGVLEKHHVLMALRTIYMQIYYLKRYIIWTVACLDIK